MRWIFHQLLILSVKLLHADLFFPQKAWCQRCAGVRAVQENNFKHGGSTLPVGAQEDASEGGARVCQGTTRRNTIPTKSDVAWPAVESATWTGTRGSPTLPYWSRCKSTMAVERAGTRSHRVNGEHLEDKYFFKRWDHRIGPFRAWPRGEAISILSLSKVGVVMVDERSSQYWRRCEAWKWRKKDVSPRPAGTSGQELQRVAGCHRVYERKEKRALETIERKQKLMSGAPEEVWKRVLQGVVALEDKISEVEVELQEAKERNEDARGGKKEGGNGGAGFSDTSRVGLEVRTVSGGQSSEGDGRCQGELGVGVDQMASNGDRSSMSSAVR